MNANFKNSSKNDKIIVIYTIEYSVCTPDLIFNVI